jgi:hypothetical protein
MHVRKTKVINKKTIFLLWQSNEKVGEAQSFTYFKTYNIQPSK